MFLSNAVVPNTPLAGVPFKLLNSGFDRGSGHPGKGAQLGGAGTLLLNLPGIFFNINMTQARRRRLSTREEEHESKRQRTDVEEEEEEEDVEDRDASPPRQVEECPQAANPLLAARRLLRDPKELLANIEERRTELPPARFHFFFLPLKICNVADNFPPPRSNCSRLEEVVCGLETRELWQKFFQVGPGLTSVKAKN